MSQRRFLWVIRNPDETMSSDAFLSAHKEEEDLSFDFLPDGVLERTKGTGLEVASWAPQARILSHRSTEGFITHCGWNSALEGIVHGVPLVAWPLYAEQKLTALLLAQGNKVALRAEEGANELVGKEDIAQVVKELMEGEGDERENLQTKGCMQLGKPVVLMVVHLQSPCPDWG